MAEDLNIHGVNPATSHADVPGEGPGYRFFYGELAGTDEATHDKALRLGEAVDRSGRLADAQRAYHFFRGEMTGTDDRVKLAAAKAAATWVSRGHGTLAELQQTYKFFLGEFSRTDDKAKAAASFSAALGVGIGMSPAEIMRGYREAYRMVRGTDDDAKLTAALIAVGYLD